jgi:hypothetical protein
MRKNLCEKSYVGTVIYSDKCGKTAVRETVNAEINNVIYMELYSGAKTADGKYRKTYVEGSIDLENTVLPGFPGQQWLHERASMFCYMVLVYCLLLVYHKKMDKNHVLNDSICDTLSLESEVLQYVL